MNELHTKYRPQTWDDVVGHASVIKSIRKVLDEGSSRAFLLTGSSGVGKTTIARIIARHLDVNVPGPGWIEHDAATHNGVDAMRDLKRDLLLRPLGGGPFKVVCMDECHQLTKQSWNALLKDVEEPPKGVHWVFCTTELGKVPRTIRTRCSEYALKPLTKGQLEDVVDGVIEAEKMERLDEDVYDLLIEHAQGSPRQALVGLAKLDGCDSVEEAEYILETVDADNKDVADFCRALMKGAPWTELCSILNRMENPQPESIRNVVCAWFTKMALTAKSVKAASRPVAILRSFGMPYPPSTGLYPVLVSIADMMEE